MHGDMRMYRAKKTLAWTTLAEQALEFAVGLDRRHEPDGHDPSGYAGIASRIGWVHDRPPPERQTFGKIRYASCAGARSTFDVETYRKQHIRSGAD